MNWAQHALILHKKAKDGSTPLMPYLNKVWCKGDKLAYRDCVNQFSQAITRLWRINDYVNKDFKNVLMPVSREIRREQYQAILAFDKYLSNDVRFQQLFNIVKRWIGDQIYLPEKLLTVKLYLENNLCGTATDVTVEKDAHNRTVNLKLKDTVLNNHSCIDLHQAIRNNGSAIDVEFISETYDQRLSIAGATVVAGPATVNAEMHSFSYDQLEIRAKQGYVFNV
jgi:hypothetical protein